MTAARGFVNVGNYQNVAFRQLPIGWGVAVLSVATVLLGARQAGRNVERVDQLKKSLEIKDAQLRATLDAPRNRDELIDRLRAGKF